MNTPPKRLSIENMMQLYELKTRKTVYNWVKRWELGKQSIGGKTHFSYKEVIEKV